MIFDDGNTADVLCTDILVISYVPPRHPVYAKIDDHNDDYMPAIIMESNEDGYQVRLTDDGTIAK